MATTNKTPQTAIRIPPDIKEQIKDIAELEHWNFNQAMLEAAKLLIAKYTV
jgi:uncharacterized protein (DUF1778 family)